jgi:TolB-like protein/DNA-binding winged helix-turn-helix (wHTH) protein
LNTLDQHPRQYRFGSFDIDLIEGELRRQGTRVKLNEKPFQVLCVLLERAGSLVTRENLRQRLWSADTYVDFDANLNTALSTLRHTLGDPSDNPVFIETVPRQGYRFIAPVTPIATTGNTVHNDNKDEVKGDGQLSRSEITDIRPPRSYISKLRIPLAMMVFLLTSAVIGWTVYAYWLHRPAPHDKLTILVTPFENLSGDSNQDFLSDGLTDELITRLGQLAPSHLSVFERTTAMRYKHSQKSVDQISRECQSDYVLEGSIRRQGDRLRITVQLFKAGEQGSVWTEAYDRDAKDLLIIEEDVADRVARSLSLQLPIGKVANS